MAADFPFIMGCSVPGPKSSVLKPAFTPFNTVLGCVLEIKGHLMTRLEHRPCFMAHYRA